MRIEEFFVYLGLILIPLVMAIIAFLIISALIMVTYNNSIVKMNSSWKKIDYPTAMVFTLFIIFALGCGQYPYYNYNYYYYSRYN